VGPCGLKFTGVPCQVYNFDPQGAQAFFCGTTGDYARCKLFLKEIPVHKCAPIHP
jgi:hypothetical protein